MSNSSTNTPIIKRTKPTSPGRRHCVYIKNNHLADAPIRKELLEPKIRISGRSKSDGKITVRHRGGGHKKHYRLVDFKRNRTGIPAKVVQIEYDPNRTAHIALICYADGLWSYILAPKSLEVGQEVMSGEQAPIKPGNCLPLYAIPAGTTIHALEIKKGKGAQMVRTAGASAMLVGKEQRYVIVRLRSGEMRKVLNDCCATIGVVSNESHTHIKLGKAGKSRWKGIRPTVRGVAMNPVDHPHGGGEGRTSGGRCPVSPTGVKDGKRTVRGGSNLSKPWVVRSRHLKKTRRG
ncbi:MAG: 50S ribosomal protein L2 [Legionellales bacterium]|nr:50S ribosomal protein L2 [Legionellales bacterium]